MVLISFSSISGTKFSINIDESMTPRETSKIICQKLGIPITPIQFFFNNNLIHSSTSFSQLDMKEDSVILYRFPPKEKQAGIFRTSSGSSQLPSERIHFSITPELQNLVQRSTDQRIMKIYSNYYNSIQFEKNQKNRDPKHMSDLVERLVLMGYEEEASKKALRSCHYNVEMAAEMLINSSDNPQPMGPFRSRFGFGRSRFGLTGINLSENSPYKKYVHNIDNNESTYIYSPDEIKQVESSIREEKAKYSAALKELDAIKSNMEEIISQIPKENQAMISEIKQQTMSQIQIAHKKVCDNKQKLNDLIYKHKCMKEHKDYRNRPEPRHLGMHFGNSPLSNEPKTSIFQSAKRRLKERLFHLNGGNDEFETDTTFNDSSMFSFTDDFHEFDDIESSSSFKPKFPIRKLHPPNENNTGIAHKLQISSPNLGPKPPKKDTSDKPKREAPTQPRHEVRNELYMTQRELDGDTTRVLRDIANQAHVTFNEVVQCYIIAGKDIRVTKDILKLN